MTDAPIKFKKNPVIEAQSRSAVAFTVGDSAPSGVLQERAVKGIPESIRKRQEARQQQAEAKRKSQVTSPAARPSSPTKKQSRAPPREPRVSTPSQAGHTVPGLSSLCDSSMGSPTTRLGEGTGLAEEARDVSNVGVLNPSDLPPALPAAEVCPHAVEVDAVLRTFGAVEITVPPLASSPPSSPCMSPSNPNGSNAIPPPLGDAFSATSAASVAPPPLASAPSVALNPAPDSAPPGEALVASAGDLMARCLISPAWRHRAAVSSLFTEALSVAGADAHSCTLDFESLLLALESGGGLAARLCEDSVLYVVKAGVAIVDTLLTSVIASLAQLDWGAEVAGLEGEGDGAAPPHTLAEAAVRALGAAVTILTRRLGDSSSGVRIAVQDVLLRIANHAALPVGVAAVGAVGLMDRAAAYRLGGVTGLAGVGGVCSDRELRSRLVWVGQLVRDFGFENCEGGEGVPWGDTGHGDDGVEGAGEGGMEGGCGKVLAILTPEAVAPLVASGLGSLRNEVRVSAGDLVRATLVRAGVTVSAPTAVVSPGASLVGLARSPNSGRAGTPGGGGSAFTTATGALCSFNDSSFAPFGGDGLTGGGGDGSGGGGCHFDEVRVDGEGGGVDGREQTQALAARRLAVLRLDKALSMRVVGTARVGSADSAATARGEGERDATAVLGGDSVSGDADGRWGVVRSGYARALAASVGFKLPQAAEWDGFYTPLMLTAAAAEAADDAAAAEELTPEVLEALQAEVALVRPANITCSLAKAWSARANACGRIAMCVASAVAESRLLQMVHGRTVRGCGGAREGSAGGRSACGASFAGAVAERGSVDASHGSEEDVEGALCGLPFDRLAQLLDRLVTDSVPAVVAAACSAIARVMLQWARVSRAAQESVVRCASTPGLLRGLVRRIHSLSEPERTAGTAAVALLLGTPTVGVRALARTLTGSLIGGGGWRAEAAQLEVLRLCVEKYPASLAPPSTATQTALPSSPRRSPPGGDDGGQVAYGKGACGGDEVEGCISAEAVFEVSLVGAESRHARVRDAAVSLLADVAVLLGPQVRVLLQTLKPAILSEVRQRAMRSSRLDRSGGSSATQRLAIGDALEVDLGGRPRTEPQNRLFGDDDPSSPGALGVSASELRGLVDFQAVNPRPSTVGDSPFEDFVSSLQSSAKGDTGPPATAGSSTVVRGRKAFA